jgi:hypothetical protein
MTLSRRWPPPSGCSAGWFSRVRDQIVDAEVKKLELREARLRQAAHSRRRVICQPNDLR